MAKSKIRNEACYRLRLERHCPLHGQILALLVSTLARPKGKAEQAANEDILNGYSDTFDLLACLPPEQLHAVVELLDGAAEIRLSPSDLDRAVREVAGNRERLQSCLQRCEWLIRHGGSNRMILLLCPALCADDVRQMRRQLGIPVNKGRLPALPLEVRLSVAADWQATAGEADTFLRYQVLAEHHPSYTLGQLYSTVAAAEGGCL
jgi:hypothetical protein